LKDACAAALNFSFGDCHVLNVRYYFGGGIFSNDAISFGRLLRAFMFQAAYQAAYLHWK
jgi:hypothetical protein